MFKHFQTRTQLLITHIFDASCKTFMHINLIAVRRQAHWTKLSTDGLFSVRWNDVLFHTISAKWRSSKWCFGKTTFGWMTSRKNDVRLNNDSGKCRSALWTFAKSTIRPSDDSVKWLSAIFFRQNNDSVKLRFCKTTIQWNDVSGKWCGPFSWQWW